MPATLELKKEIAALPKTRFCVHCQKEKLAMFFSFSPTECDTCSGNLARQAKADRKLKEAMAGYMGEAALAADAATLARLTTQITEELGGSQKVSRMFADAMIEAFERFKDNPKASGRTPLDYFKVYTKMVTENERQQKDMDAIRELSDEDLSRMIFMSTMEDAGGDKADDMLRALAEARGMRLIPDDAIESELVNAGQVATNE